MSQALYRKYRSTAFDELVGQEHVTDLLKAAVKNGTFSHAYLFTGQKGTGKTSAARILAYAINGLPYDADTGHLDIIEIDAASNRRIDDIRDLREKVFIAPVSAKYKVYIIDEVHMLTGESFNALLKTIEEPPAHAVFILATTELHKVPATIISRTQRFHFRPVAPGKVVEHLKMIAKKENIDIDDDALRLIAEHGGGSFRDSISLLDQLGSLEGKVTADTVESILGRARSADIATLLQYVREQKQAELHALLTDMLTQGISPVTLSEQLVAALLRDPEANRQAYELSEKLMSVPKAHFPQLLLLNTMMGFVARGEGRRKKEEGREEQESGRAQDREIEREGHRTSEPQNVELNPQDEQKRVTTSGAAPLLEKSNDFSKEGADSLAANVPLARNFTVENKFSPEDSLADSHRLSSPALSDLRGNSERISDDGSGGKEELREKKLEPKKQADGEAGVFDWEAVLAATKKTNPALYSVLSRADIRLDGDTLHLGFQYALHRKKLEQPMYRTQLARVIQDVCNMSPNIVIEQAGATLADNDDQTKKVADLMGGGERVRV